MIRIEQLTRDDISIVSILAHEIWPVAFQEILEKDQIDYMLDWMYNPQTLTEQVQIGHLYYLATLDGVPVGFMGLEPNFPDVGTLRIHKLYVKPSVHGNGVGKELLMKSFKIAENLDFGSINVNVNRFNKAVDFYKYFGFEIIKEEDIKIGKGYFMEDYVMVRAL